MAKLQKNVLFSSRVYSSFAVPARPLLLHDPRSYPQSGECCFVSYGHIVREDGAGFYVGVWDSQKMDWLNNGLWIIRDCLYGDPSNLYWIPLGRALSKSSRWMTPSVYTKKPVSA